MGLTITLAKRWKLGTTLGSKGLWLLQLAGQGAFASNCAYITEPAPCGTRELYVWQPPSWEFHCKSKNLCALKAIGRMEAARRLHV